MGLQTCGKGRTSRESATLGVGKKRKGDFQSKPYFSVKLKNMLLLAALAPFLFAAPDARCGAPKPVMVHYMPWFQTPYSLGTYNWGAHWTGDGIASAYQSNPFFYFDPNLTNNGEAEIASWYYPLNGPYDSLDPVVLEYQVLLMKLGGIDGVIVDWYGPDNYYDYAINNQRTLALFNYIRKAGLKFSLCYEDATIPAEINGGAMNGVTVTADTAIAHAQQTLLYAQSNFFTDPSFLRLSNAPVFLNFGPQYFTTSSDWTSIFSVLNASNQPAFYTEDNRLPPAGAGAFDWPPMSQSSGSPPTLSSNQLQSYLISFEQNAQSQSWPSYISSAFPRFHDIYAQVGGSSLGYLDDAGGNTLTSTLSRAMTNSSSVVQIVTWNDFGEGTIVEPTVAGSEPTTEYGYTDLGIIQDLRRQYLDPSFAYHTNDLAMASQLYSLRRQHGNNTILTAEMNRIFTNIVSGNVSSAKLQLAGMQSGQPVIYGLTNNGVQLQFTIGGNVAFSVQVLMSTNLTAWQSVQTFPVSPHASVFQTNTTQTLTSFFKLQE
jgi:hypothetical protein